MDNSNLDKKIDKLINAIEFLVDAVERGKGDNGYMSNSRFVRRIKDGGNDYLYKEFEELGQDDIEKIRDEIISNYQKGIKKANRKFNQLRKDLDKASTQSEKDEIRRKINENERKKNELKRNKKKISNTDIEDYYNNYVREDSDYQLSKRWKELGKNEKKHYKDEQDFKNSEREKFKYHQTSNERDEVRRRIANSGLGTVGRYGQKMFDMQQRAADLGNFANYLNHGGASKIGGMFGGKMGTATAAGLGKFGGALGKATGIINKFAGAFGIALNLLELFGNIFGAWKKTESEMIKFQTEYEKLQYDNLKRNLELDTEARTTEIEYDKDMQLKMLQVQTENMQEAMALQNSQLIKSVNVAFGAVNKGINATAYDAALSKYEFTASEQKRINAQEAREGKQSLYERQRSAEYARDRLGIENERNITNVAFETGQAELMLRKEHYIQKNPISSAVYGNDVDDDYRAAIGDNGRSAGWHNKEHNNAISGKQQDKLGRLNNNTRVTTVTNGLAEYLFGSAMEGNRAAESAKLENAAQSLTQSTDYQKTKTDLVYKEELAVIGKENAATEAQIDAAKFAKDQQVETALAVKKIFLETARNVEQAWEKYDIATNNSAINMGLTDPTQLRNFQNGLVNNLIDVGTKFGKTMDDMVNAQNNYIEATGRNKTLDEHDYGQLFGLGKYLGNDALAQQYGSEMEIFNHGISDSVDMLDDVLQDVNRIGLNGRKYTKDLVNNMKLATKYNFKGGTKELMEMAKWAQQTRFNLSSLSGMIDKVQEGGIEGVITQSAGFQVLGGNAAINSDPLGMLYDAWADPQAYVKRMQDMTKGFGVFNSKTGETEFNINESMQIAQMAKLQGRSAEELRNEIMQRNKATQVEKQISNYQDFNDEQKALITNKAEFKDGHWQVKMNDGKTVKDVSSLTADDLDKFMPQGHDEKMEDYMKQIVPMADVLKGIEEEQKAFYGRELWDDINNAYKERGDKAVKDFEKNRDSHVTELRKTIKDVTESYSDYLTTYNKNAERISKQQDEFSEKAAGFAKALDSLTTVIKTATGKLNITADGTIIKKGVAAENEATIPVKTNVEQTIDENMRQQTARRAKGTANAKSSYDSQKNKNVLVSGETGALLGGAMGSAIPVVGTAAGAAIGGVVGLGWGLIDKYFGDGISSGNGKPMLVSARDVTSVQDGTAQVAKTDPNDTALFAKSGGPFDKLFDGVFGEISHVDSVISELYDALNTPQTYSSRVKEGLVSNRFGGDVRGASTNSVSNVYDGDSLVNNRFGGDVRGGNAAINSDPLGMLYDALIDPQSYAKRMQDMTKGLGRFDAKTGERKFNINESMQIAHLAKLQGRSAEELRDEIIQRNERSQIDNKDVRSAYTNSVSNVYDSGSPVSNRFGDAVRSAYTNSVSNVYDGDSLVSNRFGDDITSSPTEVKLTINGKIELTGQNGQSIDIMDTLRNNPMFVRQITEMIVLQMNNNTHGGRNELFHNRFSG